MPKVTWLPNLHGFMLKVLTFQIIKAQNEAFLFLLLLLCTISAKHYNT